MTPGKRLRKIRTSLDLTQSQFADILGLKWHKIKDMENDRHKISVEFAQQLERMYKINPWWLLSGEGEMQKHLEQKPSINAGDNSVIATNIENSHININANDFNHSEDIKEIIELLKYAPSDFLNTVKSKLKQFKSISKL